MDSNYNENSWIENIILYEVNIRQYTLEGTFNAFSNHLDRIKSMGVNTIWLMPITPISKIGRQGSLGSYYACSSYTKINTEFGDIDDLKNLINRAHNLGLKVIIDWVANHTGHDHEWINKHTNWYKKDSTGNFIEKNGWVDVYDLNFEVDEMCDEMIASMKYWITEFKIDGFRCDMAHLVPKEFWKNAIQQCNKLKPLFWLAECDDVEYAKIFNSTYTWQWMHKLEKYVRGEVELDTVVNVLNQYLINNNNSKKLFFTSNHDENSWNGTEFEKYGILTKALSVLCFTWNGIPLIYSGQEIPNTKRLLFFDKDCLNWKTINELEFFFKALSDLHISNVIINGESFILPVHANSILSFIRKFNDEIIIIILNLSKQEKMKYKIENDFILGRFENIFSGLQYSFSNFEEFDLLAGEYLVYKKINDERKN